MSSPTVSVPSGRASADPTNPGWGLEPGSGSLAINDLPLLSHFELAERLVQVWIRNRRGLARLEEVKARIEGANRRLAESKPGRRLVEARREWLRAERLAILLRLHADERLASALVDEIEARRRSLGKYSRARTA